MDDGQLAFADVAGLDGTIWDVEVQGVVFAHQVGSRRRKTDCAVVFGSVRLVSAPTVGAWPGQALPATLSAGAEPVLTDMFGACDLTVPASPRGYFSLLLVGSTMPFAIAFRGDEFDGSTPTLLAIGGDQPVELSPPVLDAVPTPFATVSGSVDGLTQPAGVETDITFPAGRVTVRQVGVLVAPTDGGWCVVVFASMTLVDGGFNGYFLHPNISVVVDGHMENALFGSPAGRGGCAELDDGWRQDPLNQGVENGTVFGVATEFGFYTNEPVVQAVALPSDAEDSTFGWVFVEPIALDSPPAPPGG
jgi:hypothetical protein